MTGINLNIDNTQGEYHVKTKTETGEIAFINQVMTKIANKPPETGGKACDILLFCSLQKEQTLVTA
jgi:hypothetical protein